MTDKTQDPCTKNPLLAISPEAQRLGVLATFEQAQINAHRFYQSMVEGGFPAERLLTPENPQPYPLPGLTAYQAERLIFNTRYQYHPFAIVMCQTTEEVQEAYIRATEYKLPIRVRAGGHDHAGECSGDNTIIIDVTGLDHFEYDERSEIVTLGAGYRFYKLTPKLAQYDRMIAHGTCATVGLAGFIQGGGWGPWTRKHGMCCEYLVGATVVLGDGSVVEVDEKHHNQLLWALRGGGGMSYGIVTELRVKTFELPPEIRRFELTWNLYDEEKVFDDNQESCSRFVTDQPQTTLTVLTQWENVIKSHDTMELLGTNLQIDAICEPALPYQLRELQHHCTMYGYWEGDKDSLNQFIGEAFEYCLPNKVKIDAPNGAAYSEKYNHALMSHWGRNSLATGGTPFTPDYDAPAPHKITSRLVGAKGLRPDIDQPDGHLQLIQSLTSSQIQPKNRELGLYSYVTLGAITGDFYQHSCKLDDIAFPYRNCLYTIQYQTWWNEAFKQKCEQQQNPVFVDVNRALDWIDDARKAKIEGTYGAFISFKDPAIPTEVYFDKSYQKLVIIKQECVHDKYNHLRTRKTII